MNWILKIIKGLIPRNLKDYLSYIRYLKHRYPSASYFYILKKCSLVDVRGYIDDADEYVYQAGRVFSKISIDTTKFYIYPFDQWVNRTISTSVSSLASITPDYKVILESDIYSLKKILSNDTSSFGRRECILIDHIINFTNRILKELSKKHDPRVIELKKFFSSLLANKPLSLDCAIQKLLFYNALFWQMKHQHNGLGRLDLILYDYYKADIEAGIIDRDDAKRMIREMCQALGRNMDAKSLMLPGDTGQYILLGGIDKQGKTIQNDLTEIFLEVFTENKFPDPKLILRVNKETSNTIWDKSIRCILSGNGSPLLMNESLIMKSMVGFGYNKNDVWNVGTSACWEPLIIGKSFDQNNALQNIPIIVSLNECIRENQECRSFVQFYELFKQYLRKQILSYIHDIRFDCSPLFSLFFDDCIKRKKEYTRGGAVYNYIGVQVVSFPNLINSLCNIKDYIFEQNRISLSDCVNAISSNYEGWEFVRCLFLSNSHQFGSMDKEVVSLTKDLMLFMSNVISDVLVNGEKIKIGFSSSAYIEESRNVEATLDGRRAGEPFAVHISPLSQKIDIQEIVDFAGELDYENNRMNGNVVDFILPTSFIATPDKLKTILKASIEKGVFELQLNVLDAATLKDAKIHPEKYKGLIVRVWGFSAYFNDLPEDYKDNLIKRAEAYA